MGKFDRRLGSDEVRSIFGIEIDDADLRAMDMSEPADLTRLITKHSRHPTCGIRYLGSKLDILPHIGKMIAGYDIHTAIDVFSGTTRVAQYFRQMGITVTTSDLSWATTAYAHTYVHNGDNHHLQAHIDAMNSVRRTVGWLTENYTGDTSQTTATGMGRCFQMENAKKADAALNYIHKQTSLTDWERYTLVTAVIHALDKVGNNVGMQQSYLKRWTPASYKNIDFKLPVCIKGAAGRHIEGDCLLAAANSRSPWLGTGGLYGRHDLAYVDPPYSPLAYSTYYHIWDSIVRWDKPTTALASRRRIDRVGIGNTMKSVWNVRGKAIVAFDILIARLPARYVLISYNDESIIDKDDLLLLSERHGTVKCETIEYQRNTMWNAVRDGRKVIKGQTNSELLILIDKG